MQVNFALLKRFGGYKPFLYNVTTDACKFLNNPNSNPVIVYLHGFFKSHSNMNHTCPYDVSSKIFRITKILYEVLSA